MKHRLCVLHLGSGSLLETWRAYVMAWQQTALLYPVKDTEENKENFHFFLLG